MSVCSEGVPVTCLTVLVSASTALFSAVVWLEKSLFAWLTADVAAFCNCKTAVLSVPTGYNRMLWTALKREAAYLPG